MLLIHDLFGRYCDKGLARNTELGAVLGAQSHAVVRPAVCVSPVGGVQVTSNASVISQTSVVSLA